MEASPPDQSQGEMALALDGLYSRDTFNVITFSGEYHILFFEPVPATPETAQGKKFLASRKSEGGTEMMKAIRAALEFRQMHRTIFRITVS